ncbi:hypothetical protein C0J52_04585 [Blattella germanica]|nr:hypothetical protein C0J52_04585 [Blattella germanica]
MNVDLLHCSVCKELFDHGQHKPKFLQCHHSYCMKCLISIQCKKDAKDGGGIEFACPGCHKVTRVGKKGVDSLQDNFYFLSISSATKDEVYMSDEEGDYNEENNSSSVTAWCDTCLKLADTGCALHDICNLEEGRKRLTLRLHSALEQTEEELKQELHVLEPQLAHLQSVRIAMEEQISTYSENIAVVRSEYEFLKSIQDLPIREKNLLTIANSTATCQKILTRSRSRVKQAETWKSLDKCCIKISSPKLQDVLLNVSGSNTIEKQVSFWLSRLLENKGNDEETWQLVEKTSKKSRSSSRQRSGQSSLVTTPAVSTESLSVTRTTKSILYKEAGILNSNIRCFFNISIGGQKKGRIIVELRPDIAPKMCANFVALCTGELGYGYKGNKIFKALANDHIVAGDFEKNDGTGGHSIFNNKGLFVADNSSLPDEKGALRMRGMGMDSATGGGLVGSQFHIWVGDRDFRTYKKTLVIGYVVEGLDLCRFISNLKTYKNSQGTYVIGNNVLIDNCGKL